MTEKAPRSDEERREFREEAESLWKITFGPLAWAVHFTVCYGWISVACFVWGGAGTGTYTALIAFSVGILAFIAWIGWRAFVQWDVRGTGQFSNPAGDAEDRHQFLGHAAFLLAIISFIGVVYVTMPLLMLEGCE
jgi:hypothetical protein